jgi:hypothetical protein
MFDMTGPINAGINWARGINESLQQAQQLHETQRSNQAQEAMRQQQMEQEQSKADAEQQHQSLTDQLSALQAGGEAVPASGNFTRPVAQASSDGSPMGNVAAAGMPSSVQVPADRARTVTAGGKSYQMPRPLSADEAAQAELDQKVKTAQALQRVKGVVRVGENIGGALGMDPDSEVPIESIGSLSEAAERAKPGPKYQFHYETDDNGNVTAFRTDNAGNVVKAGTFKGAAGTKAGDPNAPPNPKTAAAITQHDKLFDQENQIHAIRSQLGFDITQPDNETVIDPHSGKEVTMSPSRRKFYQGQVDKLGQQAKDIESQRQQLRQNFKLGEYAPKRAATASATPKTQYKTGDIVTNGDKQYKVTGIAPNGRVLVAPAP